MKITRKQLRSIIRERVSGNPNFRRKPAHPRDGLGKNIADVDFPIVVGYEDKSEIVYDQDSLDELLDYLTRENDIAYSLDSLEDAGVKDIPVGRKIEMYGEGRILKEYSDYPSWVDLSDQIDDISEMLDMAADKYVTSAWLFSGENEGNAIADQIAEKLEQLYRDAEALGSLINTSGGIK